MQPTRGLGERRFAGVWKPARQRQVGKFDPCLGRLGQEPPCIAIAAGRCGQIARNCQGGADQTDPSYQARATWLSFRVTRIFCNPSEPGPSAPERAAPAT